jgi:hypothetical protein
MVSHTEYRYSEPGQIIARLVDFQGNPVTVNNCTATILYPDKTFFVQGDLMTESGNISGDHYYGFTTPAGPEGVYEYQATCTYAAGAKTASVTNSFHLSSAFTSLFGNITSIQGDLTNVLNNLTDISNDLSSINASLSVSIDGVSLQVSNLSQQLNDNTTTILNAIDNVNSTITEITNNILSNMAATAYYITTEDIDAANDPNLWLGVSGDGTLTSSTSPPDFSRMGGRYYILNGTDTYAVLNSSAWGSTDEEFYGDTTYEVWFYDDAVSRPGLDNYIALSQPNWDFAWLEINSNGGEVNYEIAIFGGGSSDQVQIPRTEGWHVVQFYFNNLNVSADTADGYVYLDGSLVREEKDVPLPASDDLFLYETWGPEAFYFDNIRVHRGPPDQMSIVADKVHQTQLNTEYILTNLSFIQGQNVDILGNVSVVQLTLDQLVTDFDNNMTFQNAMLTVINDTTSNTYDYVTGTLTVNIDNVLTQLGIINATVNRIETNTEAINTTVNDILANQQAEVIMTTFSG